MHKYNQHPAQIYLELAFAMNIKVVYSLSIFKVGIFIITVSNSLLSNQMSTTIRSYQSKKMSSGVEPELAPVLTLVLLDNNVNMFHSFANAIPNFDH